MQSQRHNREAPGRCVESTDYPRSSTDDVTRREGGGALQRFLESALAGILTLVFAWQILLGLEELEGGGTDDGNATRTTASSRDDSTIRRVGCTVSTSIDQPSVGGADVVTHDNAASRRVRPLPTSQLGAAGHPLLPRNWTLSNAPACHQSMIDRLPDMPSHNCGVVGGKNVSREQVLVSGELSGASLEWTHKFPLAGDLNDNQATAMSGADRYESEVSTFRRRPLMWTTSAGSDKEPPSPCSDDLDFFRAMTAQDDGDSDADDDEDRQIVGHDDDEETGSLPEMTSSTWISLFRTFFMGGAAQQRSAAARPTQEPITERLQNRDVDDLLDRTLSTITEEGADELVRKMSEMDDDLAAAGLAAWQRQSQDEINRNLYDNGHVTGSCSSDSEEDIDDYSDVNICRFVDDAIRSTTRRTVVSTVLNDKQNHITDPRLFTTMTMTTTTAATTTKSSDELDVQVPCSDRRSATDQLPDDDGLLWTPSFLDDAAVDDVSGVTADSRAETGQNSAYARCSAVARFAPGEHDDFRRSTVPPDVAADTDVLATAASDGFAGDRVPYVAVARAAAEATSAALGDVIWQVRDIVNSTAPEAVQLQLSACCVVRRNSSSHQRPDADSSRHKHQILLTSDGVTSGLQRRVSPPSVICGPMRRQREATSCAPFLLTNPRYSLDNVDAATDSASDAVDTQAVLAARSAVSNWQPAVTTTGNTAKHGDHATSGVADVGGNCRDRWRDDGGDSRSTHRWWTDRQHDADSDVSSFNLDRPSSSSINVDTATSSFLRSVSQPDLDVQSTSSSSYGVYAQSPGARRRQQQQHRQDAGRCWPPQRQFHRRDDVDDGHGHEGGASSPRAATRHRRRSSGKQVSSSFENLVGGLLAVPQPQSKRHLANSAETPASSADRLCGRGADLLPALTAFMTTGTPATGRSSSLPAIPAAEEPVLPRHTKHAPLHVRRAKHLFKPCKSCVGGHSDNNAVDDKSGSGNHS